MFLFQFPFPFLNCFVWHFPFLLVYFDAIIYSLAQFFNFYSICWLLILYLTFITFLQSRSSSVLLPVRLFFFSLFFIFFSRRSQFCRLWIKIRRILEECSFQLILLEMYLEGLVWIHFWMTWLTEDGWQDVFCNIIRSNQPFNSGRFKRYHTSTIQRQRIVALKDLLLSFFFIFNSYFLSLSFLSRCAFFHNAFVLWSVRPSLMLQSKLVRSCSILSILVCETEWDMRTLTHSYTPRVLVTVTESDMSDRTWTYRNTPLVRLGYLSMWLRMRIGIGCGRIVLPPWSAWGTCFHEISKSCHAKEKMTSFMPQFPVGRRTEITSRNR